MLKQLCSKAWVIWAVWASVFLLVRFTVFLHIHNDATPFTLFLLYALMSWGFGISLLWLTGIRLTSHLKAFHLRKWIEIYSPQEKNHFKPFLFLKSDETFGDSIVGELKTLHRTSLRLIITVFATLPLLFIITMPPVSEWVASLCLETK